MAQRTQIRLGALSGSFVDIKTEAGQYVTQSTAVALTGSDVQDLLGGIAASLNRVCKSGLIKFLSETKIS